MQDYLTGEKDPLSDPLIKNYYQSNLDLVRTIGIKSARSALEQNKDLINRYGDAAVDAYDPTSWKYYMNLAGHYHPTDQQMVITSLDTLQTITFNRTNLSNHPNTAIEYRYGTKYYKRLVSQYPDQEDLIMGILMPCNINTAIQAEDGDILRYNTFLVEENEYSIMKDLELAIKHHIARHYVDAYSATDSYYLMAYYASLYLFMLSKLLNLRDARRNTYEVHSFHVRMFLRGYMGLDRYYPYLTQEQAMYLYRNLPRLMLYIGHDSQFNELSEKLLSPRNIQISGYNVKQKNAIDSDFTPITMIESEPLNVVQIDTKIETLTAKQLFAKEESVLYGTKDYYDANANEILSRIKRQNQAKSITKNVVTQTQAAVSIFSLEFGDIAMCHWGYMSGTGRYTADIMFDNPRTGAQQTLNAKDAFIYLYYLTLNYTSKDLARELAVGVSADQLAQLVKLRRLLEERQLTKVPHFLALRHVNTSSPTVDDLLVVVEDRYRDKMRPLAQILINQFIPLTITNKNELFYQLCLNIYKNYTNQHALASLITDAVERGYARNMVYKLYQDTRVQFVPNNLEISEFLDQRDLDSYEEAGQRVAKLIKNLYESGTGITTSATADQKTIVQAMISILRSLSSYNIQYIELISETDLTPLQNEPCMINGYINIGNGSSDSYITNAAPLPVGIQVQDVTVTQL